MPTMNPDFDRAHDLTLAFTVAPRIEARTLVLVGMGRSNQMAEPDTETLCRMPVHA